MTQSCPSLFTALAIVPTAEMTASVRPVQRKTSSIPAPGWSVLPISQMRRGTCSVREGMSSEHSSSRGPAKSHASEPCWVVEEALDRSDDDRLRGSARLPVVSIVVGRSELLGKQKGEGGNESDRKRAHRDSDPQPPRRPVYSSWSRRGGRGGR